MIKNFDEAQIEIKTYLDLLAIELEKNNHFYKKNLIHLFFKKIQNFFHNKLKVKYKSFYIYGEVGRGKTILMKNFQNQLIHTKNTYFHFHDFMNKFHQNLHEFRSKNIYKSKKNVDEIKWSLNKIIKDAQVICFDEFQVIDIADAMLLNKIFKYFFKENKVLVVTSNHHPLDLYQNGIQRELFIKFIKNYFLKQFELLNLQSLIDYRMQHKDNQKFGFFTQNSQDQKNFKILLEKLTKNETPIKYEFIAWGRKIILENSFEKNKIIVISYNKFFRNNLSTLEFNKISKRFNLIIIKNMTEFNLEAIDEIRKFTLFIDEIYENKTALILSGNISMNHFLLISDKVIFFKRTHSRLNEIFSKNYYSQSKYDFNLI